MKYPILKIKVGDLYEEKLQYYFLNEFKNISPIEYELNKVDICLVLPLLKKREPRWIGITDHFITGTVVDKDTVIFATPFPRGFSYADELSQEQFDEINSDFFNCVDNENQD